MAVRQIRSDERDQIASIYNNAYRVPMETASGWAKLTKLANTRGIFERKRLVSMLQIIPYDIWIGGKLVSMGGIGGVATWADRQGRGYAGELMRDSLRTMRERKQWTSILYPFSYRYYGKFGWAIAGRRLKYTNFRQHQIQRFEEASMVDAGKDTTNIKILNSVYEKMATRFNLCCKRPTNLWKRKLDGLEKQNAQLYLIRDRNEYLGWFICENKRFQDAHESITREFTFVNDKAVKAMMGFFSTLPTNVKNITISTPYALDLWRFFREPYIDTFQVCDMQFRIVDIVRAVKARGYPAGMSCSLVFSIEDTYAPWNTGTWRLELQEGKVNSFTKSSKKPDFECDIGAFSQLFCGYMTPDALIWHGTLKVKNKKISTLLNAMFHDFPTHILDWF